MDDLLTGSDSIENALILKTQISEILDKACFPLRKWNANKTELLEGELSNTENYIISDDKNTKTLGLFWKPRSDTLNYSVNLNLTDKVTKRTVLSTIAKIFDPLGLINPVTVRAKLILQILWQEHLEWDESVSQELYTAWKEFHSGLQFLNKISIPRQITSSNGVKYQLHGFCDASERSYGSCIYLRTTDLCGNHTTRLVCAKSRVAPLKKISLPRLELCGAVLLVELINKVRGALEIDLSSQHLWCDSTIVLAWIATQPAVLKTFVANRITIIQEGSSVCDWHHVKSESNPADILSRGCSPEQLLDCGLWWHGPTFLIDGSEWPKCNVKVKDIPEKRSIKTLSLVSANFDLSIFERYSSFTKLHRVLAFILRFIRNCNSIHNKITGDLHGHELDKALHVMIKIVQNTSFCSEIDCLRKGRPIHKSSKLLTLNPFLDENGLLRVGGRIKNSNVPYDNKHPFLLPPKHVFTKLLVEAEHKRLLHAGSQTVLASLRNKFWPINGKNVVRGILRKCLRCYKTNPAIVVPRMGDLPRSRLTPARPFSSVGIDFAGPILIKDGTLKNRKLVKSYICIFVCFVTKAVHIELAGDLTTDTFLNCLKRFVARRGFCTDVYSDNGTNLVGGKNKLYEAYTWIKNSVADVQSRDYLLKNKITWHFIPPRAPHFGGLWEAVVKSAKTHLVRVVGDAHLTYEQLYTVLCQIECILNSRPLTPLSVEPNDESALTPGHFLIGDSLAAIPERVPDNVSVNRLKLYERLQTIVSHFWKRWSSEYLHSVQQRTKWKSDTSSAVKIGSLVLLKEDNLPVMQWITGRIVATHPGADNVVRVVSVKTNSGTFKRSVVKICVLPVDT